MGETIMAIQAEPNSSTDAGMTGLLSTSQLWNGAAKAICENKV